MTKNKIQKKILHNFLKPNAKKITLSVVLGIAFTVYLFEGTSNISYIPFIVPITIGGIFSRTIFSGFDVTIVEGPITYLVATLVFLIEVYLIVCITFLLYKKMENKLR